MKYIFTLICALFSFFNLCEAHSIPIIKVDSLQYSVDTEHYEKLNEQDYYMYLEVYDVHTRDVCILHILTNKEDGVYVITDSVVRTHHGFTKSYVEYEKYRYDDNSIVGVATQLLDKYEEKLKEESKV